MISLLVDLATVRPPTADLPHIHTDYVMALQRQLEESHYRVGRHLRTAGQAMWQQYSPGDLVWLHNPHRKPGWSPKLQASWKGLYKVVMAVLAVTYRFDIHRRKKAGKAVHVDRLWRHLGGGVYSWGEKNDRATDDGGPGRDPLVGLCPRVASWLG
ncbi:hypothetical protein O3P69_006228 [Scylla paramamosain]|uniref:Uncharacterized protein n=1 Tax=Scylla paramamosain TaxID=85552 RepID=A0AAW0UAS3_SCYPA